MPTASNITINDSAAVAVVFTNVTGASGALPAVYYAKTKGTAAAFQPKLSISSKGMANSGREVKMTLALPVTVIDENGIEKVLDTEFYEIRKVGPGRIPALQQADAAAYVANALDVAQIREAFRDGFAPS